MPNGAALTIQLLSTTVCLGNVEASFALGHRQQRHLKVNTSLLPAIPIQPFGDHELPSLRHAPRPLYLSASNNLNNAISAGMGVVETTTSTTSAVIPTELVAEPAAGKSVMEPLEMAKNVEATMAGHFYSVDCSVDKRNENPEVQLRCAELSMLLADANEAEAKLAANVEQQQEIAQDLQKIGRKDRDAEIKEHEERVAQETSSRALGSFLGSFWSEMRGLTHSFYEEHLLAKRKSLQEDEGQLQEAVAASNKALDKQVVKYSGEDSKKRAQEELGDDEEDGEERDKENDDDED